MIWINTLRDGGRNHCTMAHYQAQFSIRRLWIIFAVSMVVMFGALFYYGGQIYQAKPPIPATVESASGETLFTRAQIERGQNLWQSMGGMQQGSIWGQPPSASDSLSRKFERRNFWR